MKAIYILCLLPLALWSQINPKEISVEKFYKKELQQIVALKKENTSSHLYIKLAKLYENINVEDSAYNYYYKAYQTEKTKKSLDLQQYNELLFNLHLTQANKHNYHKDKRFYLNELLKNVQRDTSDQWKAKIWNEVAKDYFIDSVQPNKAILLYEKVRKTKYFKQDKVFQSRIYLNLGNIYSSIENFPLSKKLLEYSLLLAQNNNDSLGIIYANINLGVLYKKQNQYTKALEYFNQAEKVPNTTYKTKLLRIIYANKRECYEALKSHVPLAQANVTYNQLDSLVNDFQKNSNFYEIDVKYQLNEKTEQLKQITLQSNQNRIIYGIITVIIFALALYSFIRWKKVDAKKKELVTEKQAVEILHTSTVKELEKIKQLVIEDHITLKNRTKIYINELLYIKADDHYLELITLNKKEFVRGKISEIMQQLPPNFKQSHRSYVVNINFIQSVTSNLIILKNNTEIPLSRNYKSNFG